MPLPHQLTELTVIPNDNHHDLVMYNDDKRYLPHMPCPLQIIQLVEVAAPPRRIPSSYYSSSRSSSSDSESICSSYCSSNNVDEAVQDHQRFNKLALIPQSADDDYALRMKRILAWRENFSAYLSVTISGQSHISRKGGQPFSFISPTDGGLSSSLKRKLQCEDNDSDTVCGSQAKLHRSLM